MEGGTCLERDGENSSGAPGFTPQQGDLRIPGLETPSHVIKTFVAFTTRASPRAAVTHREMTECRETLIMAPVK